MNTPNIPNTPNTTLPYYCTPIQIGNWILPNRIFVAPMAGVTDRPFRRLCKQLGAGHTISEMAASNPQLWDSVKTSRRLNHTGEIEPITVQIAGSDPEMMAQAALFNINKGAKIIDINMGCPAKKVCKTASGSALLRNEKLIAQILEKVVKVCTPLGVPVTLKTRTGWDQQNKNILTVAQIAQDIGISLLTIHGRTRCDFYEGQAEYNTIAQIKQALNIPVCANGDINSPEKAKWVFDYTQVDAIMIGRSAQGNPWIFEQINAYLRTGQKIYPPSFRQMQTVLLQHLKEHYEFYGEYTGVRTARKHIGWYIAHLEEAKDFWPTLHLINDCQQQYNAVKEWLDQLILSNQR